MKRSLRESSSLILILAALYTVTASIMYLALTKSYQTVSAYDSFRMLILCLMLPIFIKYVIQLLGAPIYSAVEAVRHRRGLTNSTPTVSVCIPAWNEEVGIVKTIRSVLNTAYPKLEVLIINDGSTDSTHEKISHFISNYEQQADQGAKLKYLHLENGGKAKALNQALKQVTGEIVITVDADSVMDTDAIVNLVKRFTSPDVAAVAGNVIISNKRKPIELMQQLEYLYGFFFKRADALFNSVYIIGGAAAAYRREALEAVGGFDHEIITEDIEMSTRMLAHGYKTRYAPDAVIYTEGPSDLKSLSSQRLRWKYGRILTFIKHRKLFFSLRKKHNPYLSWLILPVAVYSELMLLLETFMLSAFVVYTVHTNDYMPLAFVTLLMTFIISVQVLVDSKARFHSNLLLLAPVALPICYAMDLIELQALIRSLKRFVLRKELKWQKWVRVGVLEDVCNLPTSLPLAELDSDFSNRAKPATTR
ncbi:MULTISPECIES: glycosyltransferase family 2 protein [unclassified Lentimonas]|uniref:glycosyltransferase n=1 Tax=unclassified Lentimonas TaxID=2630993 RepID=UPI00132586D6|nr:MULTISPECIES: glycosyltransferase family 2 protein [unclassified Lentimonas]CAA6679753.1 Glycosyl transferase, family 2 [Lentimonas sp. CC4]CAA6683481.1 Glycosyl transferase, family 2 [Lentimonas sp. CC6]CAA6693196.1 Glycosyl transferase, family 2 [Lentimonas sp. CC10]CAA6695512.1 Glycosyl transferase, family 2 [Lentimonas sp. CC19]CAA7071723.1 Glycosyl transferase, family 2 [Lentimonas sp. CC11]